MKKNADDADPQAEPKTFADFNSKKIRVHQRLALAIRGISVQKNS